MEQRRFAIRQLKELGYAKTSLEAMIQEEIVEFLAKLKCECDHPISLKTKFHIPILNIIWALVAGERNSETAEAATIFKMCTE